MVKIRFLGSCREVGRSGILIESKDGTCCLLDYGVRFNNEERLPLDYDSKDIKAVALSHCHIDHSGAIPYIYTKNSIPLLTNPLTLDISKELIKDMIRVSSYPYPFGPKEVQKMIQNAYFVKNHVKYRIKDDFLISFYNAGHIPGSVSILVEVDGKRILYTGDINTGNTNLVKKSRTLEFPEIDACIIESTYALKEHPPREELEKKFTENVINVTENGGKVLVPAFGVARSQETLMILWKHNYKGKIFLDGMAKLISMIYLDYPEYLKDVQRYKDALKRTRFISKRKARELALKSNGVIVSPSGMLKGGAALNYIKEILDDKSSAIYLVGYQVEGTPGRTLIDSGQFEYTEDGKKLDQEKINLQARCNYDYFDFSSHADKNQLKSYVEDLFFRNSASKNIFCIHGDNKSTTSFASVLSENDFNSVAPEVGEVYKI